MYACVTVIGTSGIYNKRRPSAFAVYIDETLFVYMQSCVFFHLYMSKLYTRGHAVCYQFSAFVHKFDEIFSSRTFRYF